MDREPETAAALQHGLETYSPPAHPSDVVSAVYLGLVDLCTAALCARGKMARPGLARSEWSVVDFLVRPRSCVVGSVDRSVAKRGSTVHDLCGVRDTRPGEANRSATAL